MRFYLYTVGLGGIRFHSQHNTLDDAEHTIAGIITERSEELSGVFVRDSEANGRIVHSRQLSNWDWNEMNRMLGRPEGNAEEQAEVASAA